MNVDGDCISRDIVLYLRIEVIIKLEISPLENHFYQHVVRKIMSFPSVIIGHDILGVGESNLSYIAKRN
ncbi:MAG: hypothetical protein CMD96_03635 [Gammaproteobacteria bacterium]|jgi:hypothetical protein|nr:hypothetical protein [Gammaproteobacteria bacterium]HJP17268.1 hypothetical protein [Nitrospinota bacterium]